MGLWDDYRHDYNYELHMAKQDITCSRCGVPAYWQEVVNKDGFPQIKLFAGGRPHDCRPAGAAPGEFEDLTGADLG